MSIAQILLGCLIVFISFGIKAVTGLGAAIICVSLLSLFIDIKIVVPLELIFELTFGFVIIFKTWKEVRKDLALIIVLSSFAGVLVGARILAYASENTLRLILAIVIFFFALRLLLVKPSRESRRNKLNIPLGIFCGFAGGSVGGATGQQGPPIAIYAETQIKDRRELRSTLIAIFFINDILRAGVYLQQGLLTQKLFLSSLYFIPFLVAAAICGSIFHLKINETVFNRMVGCILICSSIMLTIPLLRGM